MINNKDDKRVNICNSYKYLLSWTNSHVIMQEVIEEDQIKTNHHFQLNIFVFENGAISINIEIAL